MRNLLLTTLAFVLFLCSCEDLSVIGENPNNVSETPPQLLLTQVQENAFQVQGKSPLYASRIIVSTAGENELQYFKWNRGDFDEYDRLRNVTKMIEEAQRTEKPAYEALGKFFRAYYFYELTLRFGDIPYSEALSGESDAIYEPKFDPQKQIFQGILDELEEANGLLEDDDIIGGDIIYSGDAAKWRKLINSFRLKVLMTLSNKEGDADLDIENRFATITENEPIISSVDENGQLEFFDQIGSQYGEFNDSDYGSGLYVDSTFIQRLQDRQDPRLFIYADQTKNAKEQGLATDDFDAYEGGNPIGQYGKNDDKAAAGNISKVDLRYTIDPTNEPHVLLGYSELQLILAEARVRGWINSSTAQTYYENGVRANFEFYNRHAEDYASYVNSQSADTYLQNAEVDFSNASSDEERIHLIVIQKYLRSFLQGGWTPYFEQLRTGYPELLQPQSGTPPKRWIYPQSEYQNNNQNVSEAISRQFGEGNDTIRATPW
ncbi:SusD/RagB family nutrient-binding outer membrane lipoprotein [Aliifodinibius sp. S!AR15-10]|uniref:SusD/RagB family nutrient-binding outer membrane lipoprotein n=1 Tax=Aliifodinibius sp. S!AR15-10 TaxID=2950437 RepID=UPI00285C06B9|nr:SusD/RagB family nutrient-binding outer membrane lipoprotein [Aliifodinibius sp. S!AR15-10]MDR8391979.1 SusD/RagB family nutrient-binding outer membrane lipoprotein [Aliifodinibius sp. S!AR15-10]